MSHPNSTHRTRLNKILAESGISSRRGADRLIEEGHVTVNGKRVFELGIQVDPQNDKIMVDGKPIRRSAQKLYLLFNKPRGVLTTMEDPEGRPTVADYLQGVPDRVYPIGRLDWDSEGLLLLTNDGDFANKVMHPSHEVTKTYLVKVDGQPKPEHIQKLLRGVSIIGGRVAAKSLEKIRRQEGSDQYDWYKIVITEGKNRQIRQMFAKIGFDVMKLQRVAIGRLRIGSIKKGEVVFLNESTLNQIFLADSPEELKTKKSYKGRAVPKTASPEKRAAAHAKRKSSGPGLRAKSSKKLFEPKEKR